MRFYRFKLINVGSLSAGGSTEKSWTADEDYTIKRIYAVETTETAVGLQFLTATLRVDDYTFTTDSIPLSMLDGYKNQVPEIDVNFAKGRTFYASVTNNHSSSAISCYLVLELWKQ